jgi:hypothetical protein
MRKSCKLLISQAARILANDNHAKEAGPDRSRLESLTSLTMARKMARIWLD